MKILNSQFDFSIRSVAKLVNAGNKPKFFYQDVHFLNDTFFDSSFFFLLSSYVTIVYDQNTSHENKYVCYVSVISTH